MGAGAAIACGAPPLDVWLAVPTGLAAFAALIELRFRADDAQDRLPRRALLGGATGFVFGTTVNVCALSFVPAVIARFTPLPWAAGMLALLLVAMLQSLAFLVTALCTIWLRRLRVPLPIAFAFGHLLGTHAPAVFPWTIAAGLVLQPWSVQAADTFGETGVASLWALVGGSLASAGLALHRRERHAAGVHAAVAAALAGAIYVHGTRTLARIDTARAAAHIARIGLVHPAYPATLRWEPSAREALSATLHRLTTEAEAQRSTLTVWPESAHPYRIPYSTRRDQQPPFGVLGPRVHGPVLAGVLRRRDAQQETNSAILVEPDGHFDTPYDKLFLLAFGERVPLADQIPWLKRTFARGLGLVPGERNVLQHTGQITTGVLICFEDTLPKASRSLYRNAVEERLNLITNLTNDGWFTGTTEPLLHVRLGSMRAVETRLDLVRSVNGGYTAHVDAAGRIVAEEHRESPQVLLVDARLLDHGPTAYVRFGELPAFGALTLAGVLGHLAVRRRDKTKKALSARRAPSIP